MDSDSGQQDSDVPDYSTGDSYYASNGDPESGHRQLKQWGHLTNPDVLDVIRERSHPDPGSVESSRLEGIRIPDSEDDQINGNSGGGEKKERLTDSVSRLVSSMSIKISWA